MDRIFGMFLFIMRVQIQFKYHPVLKKLNKTKKSINYVYLTMNIKKESFYTQVMDIEYDYSFYTNLLHIINQQLINKMLTIIPCVQLIINNNSEFKF